METKSLTREQLLAWAMDKLKHEAEEIDRWCKAVKLLSSPILTIVLVHKDTFQPCVDVNNGMGGAFYGALYGERSDADYFYDALRIAYLCEEVTK